MDANLHTKQSNILEGVAVSSKSQKRTNDEVSETAIETQTQIIDDFSQQQLELVELSNPYKNKKTSMSYTTNTAKKVTPTKPNVSVHVEDTTKISDKKKNSSDDARNSMVTLSYQSELRLCDISSSTEAQAKKWFPQAKSLFNEKMKASINTVSFQGLPKERNAAADVHKLEIDISQDDYCEHCLQTHEFCHKKVHMNYVIKKVFTVYQHRADMCASEHIMGTIRQAYNESRRVDVCTRFRFYDIKEEPMPGCVEELGKKLVSTVKELRGATRTNQDIKDGIVQYIRAKRFRRG